MNQSLKTSQFSKGESSATDYAPSSSSPGDHSERRASNPAARKRGLAFPGFRPATRLLGRTLAKCGSLPLRFVLPGGNVIENRPSESAVPCAGTIRIHDDRTVWAIALDPLFQFPEAYADGRLDIDGDLQECLAALHRMLGQQGNREPFVKRLWNGLRRPYANSLGKSQKNIHHHYDIGNDFYKLWLDKNLLYTCAYFSRPDMTLEQAQVAKMDHVCRKLQLEPGMRVVEAGCGWGALAIHMAKHYGVHVTASNISREQIAWARNRAKGEGLQNRVQFVDSDWRNIQGKFDAFVSVGMLEHVGVRNYRKLGKTIRACLHSDGIGLIHTIGQNVPLPLNSWIERRIFPGAYPPTLKQMMDLFETENFSVLDVENLRLHYADTLGHWLDRFERSGLQIRKMFDIRFVRLWRFYLASSQAAFETGNLQLFQVVFANGSSNLVPRTREHLYGQPRIPFDLDTPSPSSGILGLTGSSENQHEGV